MIMKTTPPCTGLAQCPQRAHVTSVFGRVASHDIGGVTALCYVEWPSMTLVKWTRPTLAKCLSRLLAEWPPLSWAE